MSTGSEKAIADAYARWRHGFAPDMLESDIPSYMIGPFRAAYDNGLLLAPFILDALDRYSITNEALREAIDEVRTIAETLPTPPYRKLPTQEEA